MDKDTIRSIMASTTKEPGNNHLSIIIFIGSMDSNKAGEYSFSIMQTNIKVMYNYLGYF